VTFDEIVVELQRAARRVGEIEEEIARTDPWFLINEARTESARELHQAYRDKVMWKRRAIAQRRRARHLEQVVEKLQARVDLLEDGPLQGSVERRKGKR